VILHIEKLSVVMSYAYWKQLGAFCCSWRKSDANFI